MPTEPLQADTRRGLFYLAGQFLQMGVPMTSAAGNALGYFLIGAGAVISIVALFWKPREQSQSSFVRWPIIVPGALLTVVVLMWAASSSPAVIKQLVGLEKPDWSKMHKELITDKTFINTRVILDGYEYSHCTFENVTLVLKGIAPWEVHHSIFKGSNVIDIQENPAAHALWILMRELKMTNPDLKVY